MHLSLKQTASLCALVFLADHLANPCFPLSLLVPGHSPVLTAGFLVPLALPTQVLDDLILGDLDRDGFQSEFIKMDFRTLVVILTMPLYSNWYKMYCVDNTRSLTQCEQAHIMPYAALAEGVLNCLTSLNVNSSFL
jgi:hypothetical protein